MIDVRKITIEEFENKIYDRYTQLFSKEEQRDWKTITVAYKNGVEEFYGIYDEDNLIGFFMIERINNYPYYLDYFAIFNEYQSKGYGSLAIKTLLEKVIKENGILGEIEKVDEADPVTVRRWNFYKKIGFKKYNNLFYFNGTTFELIVYPNDYNKDGSEVANMLYDYYICNIGEEETKKSCKIL